MTKWKSAAGLAICLLSLADAGSSNSRWSVREQASAPAGSAASKADFIESIISRMTVNDLVLQLHLTFGDDIVGKGSNNELYDNTMRFTPGSPIGVMHDWYPMNKTYFNSVQQLQLNKSHLKIPMMLVEECLHGVGSFKQSIFPQQIGMSASFDTDIVYRVGRAIGTEARSIGIHGCFSPVLDLAQDPRWGRAQEGFGEDKILTSHIGVAYSSGLSKNGSWSEPDAVYPIMKHFAAHGAAQAGHNTAPFTGRGMRQIQEELLIPFKAVYDLGGARGVMMAYNEIDDIPAAVHPMLYNSLNEWNFDGFTLADDTCMRNLLTQHKVGDSQADIMQQWFNAGGMIDFYDWDLESYVKITNELVANKTVPLKTLQSHVRKILGLKWDLGLFKDPFIPQHIDPLAIVSSHQDVALEAAHKSIVLLKNNNQTLPLSPSGKKIALIGPFADTLNFGDYAGALGQYPAKYGSTIRQGIINNLKKAGVSTNQLKSSWGTNSWEYNNQYVIPSYLLSTNSTTGGLEATYFSDTDFKKAEATRVENPALDWGIYPPPGLPSNNFSAVWDGYLRSPADVDVDGWIGVAIGPNSTVKLYIDEQLATSQQYGPQGTLMGNIEGLGFIQANNTLPPQGGVKFTFKRDAKHHVRIEFQSWNTYKKTANVNSVNSQLVFWWNLVAPNGGALSQAVAVAKDSDIVLLAVGAAWNSDGESGDRATLDLAPSQEQLAQKIFELGKPVVLILEGGRPFAIPEHYKNSAAVLNTYFGGQAGGQAIADVIFGKFNPGGRLPLTIPYHVGQIPAYYNYKPTARAAQYLDIPSEPAYPFGFGLSYTTFSISSFTASVSSEDVSTQPTHKRADSHSFGHGDWITFTADVKNNGTVSGSYVAQVYLLGRISTVTQPVKQLVAFQRVYLDAGQQVTVSMELEVDRYLMILNRKNEWELENGAYTFAVLENGGSNVDTSRNISMTCVG